MNPDAGGIAVFLHVLHRDKSRLES